MFCLANLCEILTAACFAIDASSALPPGLTITGLKVYTYKELAKATGDFCASCELGEGGYGRVYKGILADGSKVAIKRSRAAQLFKEAVMQRNNVQFYNEIELLSRVHHRNLVLLLGYCHDQGEQVQISVSKCCKFLS